MLALKARNERVVDEKGLIRSPVGTIMMAKDFACSLQPELLRIMRMASDSFQLFNESHSAKIRRGSFDGNKAVVI
jgi:hypothetical protein